MVMKQNVSETAGRSADIETAPAGRVDGKVGEGFFKLEAAARNPAAEPPFQLKKSVGRNFFAGLPPGLSELLR